MEKILYMSNFFQAHRINVVMRSFLGSREKLPDYTALAARFRGSWRSLTRA